MQLLDFFLKNQLSTPGNGLEQILRLFSIPNCHLFIVTEFGDIIPVSHNFGKSFEGTKNDSPMDLGYHASATLAIQV